MKEKEYVSYKGVFQGKKTKRMTIRRKQIDDLINLFENNLPPDEEGVLRIYEKNLLTGEQVFVKKISIINSLFLTREESIKRGTILTPSKVEKS
jgi:hypothetical protein